jgi:hypothetical protein
MGIGSSPPYSPVFQQCHAKKFFCGRNTNLVSTCRVLATRRVGLLMSQLAILHPPPISSPSPHLKFHKKIESPGFFAPGFCLFDDLAYVNSAFMMTPFKNMKSGAKDNFNFYHSQLQIYIECGFGMFVGWWGILRRGLPKSMGLRN